MRAASAGALLMLTACPTVSDTSEPIKPELALRVSTEQRLAQGATTIFTATITRKNFTGDVSLAASTSELPAGVTLEFDPQVLKPGVTESIVRVTASPNAPVEYVANPAPKFLPIVATGPDGTTARETLRLVLTASSLAGITMNITPPSVDLILGEEGDFLATIARQGNYTGAVTLAPKEAEVLGMTATVTPVAGVPDTWRIHVAPTDIGKMLVPINLVGGDGLVPFSFVMVATPAGLAPLNMYVTANIKLPFFNPNITRNLTIEAGKSDTTRIIMRRSVKFTAPITMTIDEAPPGITATISPNPVLDDAAIMTVNVASTVAAGDYLVRYTGTPTEASAARPKSNRVGVTVTAKPPASKVARIVLEPMNAEITAPATQQFAVNLYDANGTLMVPESGGAIIWTSSDSLKASMNGSGLATGILAGTTTITARYVLNGETVVQASTPLTVYAAGSAGHYGSARISTQGNVRTIRRGESVMFQVIVRNSAGTAVTSGVSPAPTAVSSNPGVISIEPITGPVAGYFFDMTAAFNAPLGTEVRIRYDVTGAGGELIIRVVP